ncbi:MAG: amidohydrolase family protein [Vicinamibacterales bacterium]|nr:amidohydrolase family protein [Vicinamibacterales bacterium]
MKVDAHVHFWRYDPAQYGWIDPSMGVLRRDFLPADLASELDRAGVGACIAVQARQSAEETRWLLDLADAHPFIAGVVGWVDLQSDEVAAEFEQVCRHPRLVGFRHIVQTEPDDRFLLRPAFCRGIAMLEDLDLAYDILIYPKQLAVAAEFVSRFPCQRFVLDHLAKPEVRSGEIRNWAKGLRRLAEFPNVYCKLSGLVTEADWGEWTPGELRPYLDTAFECFGAYRLMAGSDWPVCTLAADHSRTWAVVDDYLRDRPGEERDAVLGGNAQRFWRFAARELV